MEKEKFKNKREKADFLLFANHVFNKILIDFDKKKEKYNEEEILSQCVEGLTFNDCFGLMYAFRCYASKEIDKVVKEAIEKEV